MDIGYACICIGDHNRLRGLQLAYASKEKLFEVGSHNLKTLESNIKYNIRHGIRLFRISSDIFPLVTHEDIDYDWKRIHQKELDGIKQIVSDSGMKLSMHPGQYTVLNSMDGQVAEKAIKEIDYHSDFLSSISPDERAPVIIHVSSAAGDKKTAAFLFAKNFHKLSDDSKKRLCIENDERSSSARDIYSLACTLNIPAVFDNLHNMLNPSYDLSDRDIIKLFSNTYSDRKQKIHYSQQHHSKKRGAHSITIDHMEFISYVNRELDMEPDVMLEVKDKDLSCVKCINVLDDTSSRKYLEWARYKYFVMERGYERYKRISGMFADTDKGYDACRFYDTINEAVYASPDAGGIINTAMHVWGYFKKTASFDEKERYSKLIKSYEDKKTSDRSIKKFLLSLALKYDVSYLKESLYFFSDVYRA
jgi:UV DNA damage endonuclease